MNARGAGSCDQAVRPRHVRRVGDGDEEQKAGDCVGEHVVERQDQKKNLLRGQE